MIDALKRWVMDNYWDRAQVAGWAQRMFFRRGDHLQRSPGSSAAGRPVMLDAAGLLDESFINHTLASPLQAPAFHSTVVTINNGAAYSFTPAMTSGLILLCCNNDSTVGLSAVWRSAATHYCTALAAGTNTNVTTGALTGTTGTAGKVTVSANSADGMIYIENRRGANLIFRFMVMA
jgi:hypothetical protein